MNARRHEFRRVSPTSLKKPQPKRRKVTISQLFAESTSGTVSPEMPAPDEHARFLTHKKMMKCAFPLVRSLCHVSEDDTHSLPLAFDRLMLLVGQDAEDEEGNFIGKCIAWMQARAALFWTASKPSSSSYGVEYYHAAVVRLLLDRLGFDACQFGRNAEFVQPTHSDISQTSSLWNALVSFKEVKDKYTDLGKFRMEHGTLTEDTAIVEFVKRFKSIVACEEYLHIFNASTRHEGFSVGTSPDGLLLWYKNNELIKVTSLEVKCPGTCSNAKCKKLRKQKALEDGASMDDEGYFCRNIAHFKAHNSIKTCYVVQKHLEMLGANTTENVYVSMGYNAKAQPVIKAYIMKFYLPALVMGVVYMRSLADLKNYAKHTVAAYTLQRWWRTKHGTFIESDWLSNLYDSPEYQQLCARVHQNYEAMICFSERATMGAHDSFANYNQIWRELTDLQKDSVRNAERLDEKDPQFKKSPTVNEQTYKHLTEAWLNDTPNHPKVDFKSPSTEAVTPFSQERFDAVYADFSLKDTHEDVSHKTISAKQYLKLCVPQGVLSDEFYFCPNEDNDFIYLNKTDPLSSFWRLTPVTDDAIVELRASAEGTYNVHLKRIGYDQSYANPLAQSEDSNNDSHSDNGSDLASGIDEYWTSDDEDEPPEVLSLDDRATLAILLQLESEQGLSAEEWLVQRSEADRSQILEHIKALTGWARIVPLPPLHEIQSLEGEDTISQSYVAARNGIFDRLFPPPLSKWKKSWAFTRFLYQRKKPWETSRKMLSPPRIGGYDDEGNIFINMLGDMDKVLPSNISQIPRGAKIKVVVSGIYESLCNFHTILIHKSAWNNTI